MTNNHEPKISILVPNFNHGPFIEQAVRSILNQTYQNFEIIIIDDCSNDNSRDVISNLVKLDKRFTQPLILPENRGKWFALNEGIRQRATGDLVTTQDADDSSTAQRLEWQVKTMQQMKSHHTLCGFANCASQEAVEKAESLVVDCSGPNEADIIPHSVVLQNVYQGFKTDGINHYYMGKDFETHGASALFHRQLWDHGMKFMPGNMGLRCQRAEDSDFNTKVTLLLQKTSVLRMPFYCYRRGSTTNPAFLELL